jgi:hypothetical protein
MALSPAEQDQVDRFVSENGVRRCSVDPGRDPKRLSNLFWKKRYKTASAARARVLATDLSRRHDATPIELEK